MNLRTKRTLDTWVGLPLMLLFNLVARTLGAILRRDHSVMPSQVLLIMKFQGMGSLVIAKPALRSLRKTHPQSKIVFWGTPSMGALARLMPEFDEIIEFDDRSLMDALRSLTKNLLRIWALKPDWVFDFEVYSKFSSLFATLTCGRNRAGFAIESVRFRSNIHTHLLFFNRYEYLGIAYTRLVALGHPDRKALFDGSQKEPWRLDTSEKIIRDPFIVINIHTGELAPERAWPKPYFEWLTQALLEIVPKNMKIALIGHGEKEIQECLQFFSHPQIENWAGKLSLKQTLQLLSQAKLVVSNDTGPLHLALSTDVPVIGLFGPTRPEAYSLPHREKTHSFYHHLYCSPCVHHWEPPPCNRDNQCLKRIDPKDVLFKCLEFLDLKAELSTLQKLMPSPVLKNTSTFFEGLVAER